MYFINAILYSCSSLLSLFCPPTPSCSYSEHHRSLLSYPSKFDKVINLIGANVRIERLQYRDRYSLVCVREFKVTENTLPPIPFWPIVEHEFFYGNYIESFYMPRAKPMMIVFSPPPRTSPLRSLSVLFSSLLCWWSNIMRLAKTLIAYSVI